MIVSKSDFSQTALHPGEVNVYNLGNLFNGTFTEFNALIEGPKGFILTDSDGVHTLHDKGYVGIQGIKFTLDQIKATPIYNIEKLSTFVRTFGSRIEANYRLLLHSIEKIGLNPNNYPRKG